MTKTYSVPQRELGKPGHDLPPFTVFFDTETLVEEAPRNRLFFGCYEAWKVSIKTGMPDARRKDAYQAGAFTDPAVFLTMLRDLPGDSMVFAHNQAFDMPIIGLGRNALMEQCGYTIEPGESIINIGRGRSPFKLVIKFDNGRRCEFRDCSNYYGKVKLSSIGEDLGCKKFDMPDFLDPKNTGAHDRLRAQMEQFHKDDMVNFLGSHPPDILATMSINPGDELRECFCYCKRDVEVLRKAIFMLCEVCQRYDITLPLTMSSIGKRIFLKHYVSMLSLSAEIVGNLNFEELSNIESDTYKGGRSDAFWKGIYPNRCHKFDVNSMYPHCMKQPVPIKFIRKIRKSKIIWSALEKNTYDLDKTYLCCVDYEIPDVEDGFLGGPPVVIDDKLCFPSGSFKKRFVHFPELIYLKEHGYLKKIHYGYEYHTQKIFHRYIDDMYERRNFYKSQGNKTLEKIYKLLMNSLYGKFGQKAKMKAEELEPGSPEYEFQSKVSEMLCYTIYKSLPTGNENEEYTTYIRCKDRIFAYRPINERQFSQTAVGVIAGYITSMARANLRRVLSMIIAEGKHVIYVDTDSVITNAELPTSTKLGDMKLEKSWEPGKLEVRAPKDYDDVIKGVTDTSTVFIDEEGNRKAVKTTFSRGDSDMASTQKKASERRESGGVDIETKVIGISGKNTKRVEIGEGMPTLPIMVQDQEEND